ncbi:hypothetical protein SDC9_173246 [bioreactor metagenome]|uniref:Uncharacterized protein n=1 Tax=bioreactor metagenome TaxID=1076179 RepID=A0A645GI35_9ZZZZ
MTGDRVRNIRNSVTYTLGIGFCRVKQGRGLLEIFICGKDQNIELLLAQRWRQTHYAFQTIGTHHAGFLVGEIAAGEERRWRHVLIKN